VALRLWFSPDLPLSQRQVSYDWKNSQFWDVPIDVGFGSVAEIIAQTRRQSPYGCGFNRWLQHLDSSTRAGGVADEAETKKVFHSD
jgi:hypothetical protein